MSDRPKKVYEELQLRLLAVAEDPTSQRRLTEKNEMFGFVVELEDDERSEDGNHYSFTIH